MNGATISNPLSTFLDQALKVFINRFQTDTREFLDNFLKFW